MSGTDLKSRIQKFALVAIAIAGLAACNSDDRRTPREEVFIKDGVLLKTPPGGLDFGDLVVFDSVFAIERIDDGFDADGYDFFLTQAMMVVISVESLGGLNPFVELYGPDGDFIVADDNGGVGTDALLVGVLEPGLYTAVVWASLDGPSDGFYEINILTGTEFGADFEELGIDETVGSLDRFIAEGPDEETFVFTLLNAASVDIVATIVAGMPDLAFQLINQKGEEVFFFDPDGLDAPVVLSEPLAAGTYLLVVSNPSLGEAGSYDLQISTHN